MDSIFCSTPPCVGGLDTASGCGLGQVRAGLWPATLTWWPGEPWSRGSSLGLGFRAARVRFPRKLRNSMAEWRPRQTRNLGLMGTSTEQGAPSLPVSSALCKMEHCSGRHEIQRMHTAAFVTWPLKSPTACRPEGPPFPALGDKESVGEWGRTVRNGVLQDCPEIPDNTSPL